MNGDRFGEEKRDICSLREKEKEERKNGD